MDNYGDLVNFNIFDILKSINIFTIINDEIIMFSIFNISIGLLGFILYIGWWLYEGKATWVFKYITFLFLGISLNSFSNFYIRYKIIMHNKVHWCTFITISENNAHFKYLFSGTLFLIVFHSFCRLLFLKRKE